MDLSNRYLKAWLSFNTSPTEDAKLNQWTTYGNPTIGTENAFNGKALQLDGSSYIKLAGVQLGGRDFYIDGWCFVDSSSPNYARVLSIVNPDTGYYMISVRKSATDATKLDFWANSTVDVSKDNGYTYTSSINSVGERVHFKLIYRYSDKIISLCINDVIAAEMSTRRNNHDATQYNRQTFDIYIGALHNGNQGLIGTVDELRIYDGTWLSYNYGTPPTLADYQNITFSVDVQRKVINPEKTWRYVNLGSADSLTVTGTTLTNLPKLKSKTGTAFYQTTRAKCFDLSATPEIWLKFDVYFDGSNRWRAYNDKDGEICGVCSYTNYSGYDFGMWQNNNRVQDFSDICKTNQLQTVLLHMISGSSAGVIEAWVDGEKIYTYTGDVNHGEDFADIYLQSDGSGTFFSNVIISNSEIGLNDGYISFTADVQRVISNSNFIELEAVFDVVRRITQSKTFYFDVVRRIENSHEYFFDVTRCLIKPIVIPPIGDHFNHLFLSYVDIYSGGAQKFILPKKSKVCVRGVSGTAFRIFSDTDPVGKITGSGYLYTGKIYAELDECEEVFIEIAQQTTPQQVIKIFMHSLDTIGRSSESAGALVFNDSIQFATGRKFQDNEYNNEYTSALRDLTSRFMEDLNSSASYTNFLKDYCDIILDNDDTGAITGLDAGGAGLKTNFSVVPEKTPVTEWIVPTLGSTTNFYGLTVQWPTRGASGGLTAQEKFILAGLNSEWIARSLELIWESYELDFNTRNRVMPVNFLESEDNVLAYVNWHGVDSEGYAVDLSLNVNMRYYKQIDKTSEDGSTPNTGLYYLDRTIAHELTHAAMTVNIYRCIDVVPTCIMEGAAELVHGIDDARRGIIVELLTTKKNTLEDIFYSLNTEEGVYAYAAGYLFLRYLAKQGRSSAENFFGHISAVKISRLLISDGATDSDYNALTDNTRQNFFPDILRILARSVEDFFDVSILNAIPVEFFAAVKRALLADVNLFTRDKEKFFADENNPFVNPSSTVPAAEYSPPASADLPLNTQGLQNFEVTLAEQQLTDQVRFSAVTPFDIMQQVKGQYLDYPYNMRVERVQQQGIVYSCDCCSDIDQLLYTQMAYKIPATTTWWKIDGEEVGGTPKTVEIETVYPAASAHVNLIANALHLTPVMQFDNFLSTVLMDEQGGVTYNDLIRDIFGWSSRVPTMLINVIIRDSKLFVIQRGHESHSVDISKAQMTVPVITKELVRTTWGSTPWSKTTTWESEFHSYVPADVVIGQGGQGGGDERVREVSRQFSGNGTQGHTTFKYDEAGRLIQTYTYVYDSNRGGQNTYTTVNNYYDDDGTMIATDTFTQSMDGTDGQSASKSTDEKYYITLPNGEKFLSQEVTKRWQNDSGLSITDKDLIDSRVTVHHPSRVGQSHVVTVSSDGEVVGEAGGQNTGDDRVTPFRNKKAFDLETAFNNSTFNSETGEWKTKTEEHGMTIHGLSLYDSSFPIHDQATLIKVTNALRNLNRKTKETVNVALYDFEHLIDFDDKIILNGATYFLSSNTARTTPRIKFEQNLSLVRWY